MQEACKLSSNVLLISDAHRQLTFNDTGRKKFKLPRRKNENEQSISLRAVRPWKVSSVVKNVSGEMSFGPK